MECLSPVGNKLLNAKISDNAIGMFIERWTARRSDPIFKQSRLRYNLIFGMLYSQLDRQASYKSYDLQYNMRSYPRTLAWWLGGGGGQVATTPQRQIFRGAKIRNYQCEILY